MNSVSLMHCADMHIGKIISAFDKNKNNIRMCESEQACLSVIDNASDCDIVLLSGDIFDSPDVSESLCKTFIDKIKSMHNVNFFYSCGNHDPYISKITDYIVCNCPDNLHVFGYEDIECVVLENIKTKVYGISFAGRYARNALILDISLCDPEYINIMCIHGDVSKNSLYNPMDMKALEKMGFDYVALGHIHNFDGIKTINKMAYAYPGCVEPSGFDECGRKGFIKGNIKKGKADLEFITACQRGYHSVSVDVSNSYDYVSAISEIRKRVNIASDLWRVTLYGENNIDSFINLELIKNNIDAFYIELIDETKMPYDIIEESKKFSLLGLCAKEILDRIENESDDEKTKEYEDAFSILYGLLDKGENI